MRPSGRAWRSVVSASCDAAPGLFTTWTDVLSSFSRSLATKRAAASVVPPAAYPTRSVMGLPPGKDDWAWALPASVIQAASRASPTIR